MAAKPNLLNRLKDVVKKSKVPNSWLNQLNENQLLELHTMLDKGDTMWEIVNKASTDWVKDMNLDGHLMMNELAKFRIDLMSDRALVKVQAERGDTEAQEIQKRLEAFNSRIDGMGRLSWVIDQQSVRLKRMVDKEEKGLPLTLTNDIVKTLGTLLSKYIEFQADLGEVKRVPSEHIVGIKTQFEKLDGSAVAKATLHMLEMVEEQSVTLELDDNGVYTEDEKLPEVEEQVLIG